MKAHGVVFRDPMFGLFADLLAVHEDPGIEVTAIEAFNEAVLHGFTRLCERKLISRDSHQ